MPTTDRLTLTMYRSVMRWAKAYGEVPLVLNPADTKAVLPAAVGRTGQAYDLENASVRGLARQAFAACKNFEVCADRIKSRTPLCDSPYALAYRQLTQLAPINREMLRSWHGIGD